MKNEETVSCLVYVRPAEGITTLRKSGDDYEYVHGSNTYKEGKDLHIVHWKETPTEELEVGSYYIERGAGVFGPYEKGDIIVDAMNKILASSDKEIVDSDPNMAKIPEYFMNYYASRNGTFGLINLILIDGKTKLHAGFAAIDLDKTSFTLEDVVKIVNDCKQHAYALKNHTAEEFIQAWIRQSIMPQVSVKSKKQRPIEDMTKQQQIEFRQYLRNRIGIKKIELNSSYGATTSKRKLERNSSAYAEITEMRSTIIKLNGLLDTSI